ncbi:MAG: hypothetical protein WHT46_00395 [Candidatus Geothermincolales bacterium]
MTSLPWRGDIRAEVEAIRSLGTWSELTLSLSPPLVAEPGQFVHVYCDGNRILRRPFSIFGLEEEGKRLKLLVKPRGGGSTWLVSRKVGEGIDLIGPLGRGFPLQGKRVALVAGGIGIAPLAYLAKRLRDSGCQVSIFWGLSELDEAGSLPHELGRECELYLSVEKNLWPEKGPACARAVNVGTVLDLFSRYQGNFDVVYACGPRSMYVEWFKDLSKVPSVPVYLSWEERMACGIGACLGCSVPVRGAGRLYARACREGPVFLCDEIDWERVDTIGP